MRVVSNTSPVSNLAIVNRLGLLKARYEQIAIPPAVHDELQLLSHPEGRERLAQALREGWIVVEPVPFPEQAALYLEVLDSGEAAALALALQTGAEVLLMDERKGRGLAQQFGQRVSGILGMLVWGKEHGHVESLTAEMVRLISEARFFIHPALQAYMRAAVGEE